ncbi:hypothetical protein F5Y08DRAFT_341175 [Xylaria arbuscula]|nr:hypothetical protein F5Y08DRAFT_341175 [Xylaria arbuscula]
MDGGDQPQPPGPSTPIRNRRRRTGRHSSRPWVCRVPGFYSRDHSPFTVEPPYGSAWADAQPDIGPSSDRIPVDDYLYRDHVRFRAHRPRDYRSCSHCVVAAQSPNLVCITATEPDIGVLGTVAFLGVDRRGEQYDTQVIGVDIEGVIRFETTNKDLLTLQAREDPHYRAACSVRQIGDPSGPIFQAPPHDASSYDRLFIDSRFWGGFGGFPSNLFDSYWQFSRYALAHSHRYLLEFGSRLGFGPPTDRYRWFPYDHAADTIPENEFVPASCLLDTTADGGDTFDRTIDDTSSSGG